MDHFVRSIEEFRTFQRLGKFLGVEMPSLPDLTSDIHSFLSSKISKIFLGDVSLVRIYRDQLDINEARFWYKIFTDHWKNHYSTPSARAKFVLLLREVIPLLVDEITPFLLTEIIDSSKSLPYSFTSGEISTVFEKLPLARKKGYPILAALFKRSDAWIATDIFMTWPTMPSDDAIPFITPIVMDVRASSEGQLEQLLEKHPAYWSSISSIFSQSDVEVRGKMARNLLHNYTGEYLLALTSHILNDPACIVRNAVQRLKFNVNFQQMVEKLDPNLKETLLQHLEGIHKNPYNEFDKKPTFAESFPKENQELKQRFPLPAGF